MTYYCLGGDLPLGQPDGSLPAPEPVGDVDASVIRRLYDEGPQNLDASDKHPALQLSEDGLKVWIPGTYFQVRCEEWG